MLSDVVTLAALVQQAPALVLAAVALLLALWTYRQARRADVATETRLARSAVRQGERIGELEKLAGMLDLRRRQVEWVLLDLGVPLPYWPADGPDQPRPRRHSPPENLEVSDLDPEEFTRERPSVPPLDPVVAARHRRG